MGNTTSTKRARVHKELERFLKPTGLYQTCAWDERQIRKLVLDGKIAPRFMGFETKYQGTDECPICFMRYCAVNRTACCKKPICSECYLQVKSPRGSTPCPFCNHSKLQPLYGSDDEDKMIEKELEVIALHDKISEAEEKGEPLVPVVNGAGEDGVEVGSAETVYANAPLATIDDRRSIEAEVRKQFELDRPRPETEVRRGTRWAEGRRLGGGGTQRRVADTGGRRTAQQQARDEEGDLRRAFLHSLGMPRDLQQVEELMLMEAIRQSMQEQERATREAAVQQQQPEAPQAQEQQPPAAASGATGGSSLTAADGKGRAQEQQQPEGGGEARVTGDEEGKDERRGGGSRERRSSSLSSSTGSGTSMGGQVVMSDGSNLISRIRLQGPGAGGRGGPTTS